MPTSAIGKGGGNNLGSVTQQCNVEGPTATDHGNGGPDGGSKQQAIEIDWPSHQMLDTIDTQTTGPQGPFAPNDPGIATSSTHHLPRSHEPPSMAANNRCLPRRLGSSVGKKEILVTIGRWCRPCKKNMGPDRGHQAHHTIGSLGNNESGPHHQKHSWGRRSSHLEVRCKLNMLDLEKKQQIAAHEQHHHSTLATIPNDKCAHHGGAKSGSTQQAC